MPRELKEGEYLITTEYGAGFIRQTLKRPDSDDLRQMVLNLSDRQLQYALLALGWKLPKKRRSMDLSQPVSGSNKHF